MRNFPINVFIHSLNFSQRFQLASVNSAIIDPACDNLQVGEVRSTSVTPLDFVNLPLFPGSLPRVGWPRLYGCPCRCVGRCLRHYRVPGRDQHHRASREQPQRERGLQQHLPWRSKSNIYFQRTAAYLVNRFSAWDQPHKGLF